MKKISYQLIFLLLLFVQFSWSQDYERILNFDTQILVEPDRNIIVTEKIKVFANGDQIKRGITRNIPKNRIDHDNKFFRFEIDILSIKHNGIESNFVEDSSYDDLVIKIGDRDIFLDAGIHEYEIKYKVYGQIGFYENYDEIYWNTTGNEWNFPIVNATALVILPNGANIIQSACYTGSQGSETTNCTNVKAGNNNTFTAQNLQARAGLTVAVGFEKGFVNPPPPPPPPTFFEKFGIIIMAIIGLILLMFYYISTWLKYGIDPQKPTVYPQFSAPENMSPSELAMIHKEMYWKDLVSFSLVNLAVKGFIQIKDTSSKILGIFKNNSFELIKLKNSNDSLPLEEQTLMKKLFSSSNILVIDGSYNSEIKNAVSNHQIDMEFKNRKLLNEGNNSKFLFLPIAFFILFFGISIFLHTEDTVTSIFKWIFALFIVIVVSTLVFLFTKLLKFQLSFGSVFRIFLLIIGVFFVGYLSIYHHDFSINQLVVGYFISFAFISYAYYVFLIKRPSEEKLHKQSLIEGFKMYISAAETQQLQFHNPPEMTSQHFETILPFAMALGVEEIWGDKFKKALANIMQNTEYQHTWYVGNTPFNYMMMHQFFNSFSNSVATSSIEPTTSGGSGNWSSGSGGGGFSGGGGGGGGGGGW
jgi:uncharacterized membrane protein YgcG